MTVLASRAVQLHTLNGNTCRRCKRTIRRLLRGGLLVVASTALPTSGKASLHCRTCSRWFEVSGAH